MDIAQIKRSIGMPANISKHVANSGTGFQKTLSAARNSCRSMDVAQFAASSYEHRLAEIRKLHEETDYGGMSDKEKRGLIASRFREAFSDIAAMRGGIYLCAGENSIYSRIMSEEGRQFQEVQTENPGFPSKQIQQELEKYYFGYDGLSDDEIRVKVSERYSGGTLVDRCGALWELHEMGLDDGVGSLMMLQLRYEMAKGTESKYGHLTRDNPMRAAAMISYACQSTISWSKLAGNTMDAVMQSDYSKKGTDPKEVTMFLNKLRGQLDKFLDHISRSERKM